MNNLATPTLAARSTAASSDTSRATITATGSAAAAERHLQISQLAVVATADVRPAGRHRGATVGAGTFVVSSGTAQAGISNLSVDPTRPEGRPPQPGHQLDDSRHANGASTAPPGITLDGNNYTINLDGTPQAAG